MLCWFIGNVGQVLLSKKETKTSTHGITGPKNIAENTGDIILSFPSKIINKVSMPSACACLFSTNRNITIFISPLMHTILLFNIWCRITEGNVSKLLFIGLLSYCMIKRWTFGCFDIKKIIHSIDNIPVAIKGLHSRGHFWTLFISFRKKNFL